VDYTLEMVPIIEQVIRRQISEQQALVVQLELQIGGMLDSGYKEDQVADLRETLLVAEAGVELFAQRLADFEEAKKVAESERMALIKAIVAGKRA
jgi:hypothetical protein